MQGILPVGRGIGRAEIIILQDSKITKYAGHITRRARHRTCRDIILQNSKISEYLWCVTSNFRYGVQQNTGMPPLQG